MTITDTGLTQKEVVFRDIGVVLKVTPQIHDDGTITLKVEPSVGSAAESSKFEAVDTYDRKASTTVRLADGETLAIGGLLRSNDTRNAQSRLQNPFGARHRAVPAHLLQTTEQ